MAVDVNVVEVAATETVEVSQVGSPVEVITTPAAPLLEVVASQVIVVEVPPVVTFIEVEVGIPGPPGPAGGEEPMKYSKRVDFVGTDEIYKAEAAPGSLDTQPVWRIWKITFVGEDLTQNWADGTAQFDKVWADRLLYTY